MNIANDIKGNFGTVYIPQCALVIYKSSSRGAGTYVEHFDMDANGMPINAHPLTVREANVLAKSLKTDNRKGGEFLKSEGILPTNILQINPSDDGSVLWYTKSQKRQLLFAENLGIPNGSAYVPSLVWRADKKSVSIFALASDERPTEDTVLYYTPFFNVYADGSVCLGTVDVNIKNLASLEEFTNAWEQYFFNSYFTHTLVGQLTNKNIVYLWKDLIDTNTPFPLDALKKNNKTLKDLLI